MSQTTTKLYKTYTQNEIVQGVLQNNDGILKSLYKEIYPKVRVHVLQNNGNAAQAKDIFQEAFVAFWKNIKEGKFKEQESSSVKGYLLTIAKNKWTDYLRSSAYKKTVTDNGSITMHQANEETAVDEDEEKKRNALKIAIQKLDFGCRELLSQFYFERKSMNEIASELKMGSASVRNKKYRCMEKLRKLALEIKNNG